MKTAFELCKIHKVQLHSEFGDCPICMLKEGLKGIDELIEKVFGPEKERNENKN